MGRLTSPLLSTAGRSIVSIESVRAARQRSINSKPGQSGNPKGAKRKPPSIMRNVKALLEKALRDTVRIRKGDKERNVGRLAIGFEQLANQFAKGDRHARRDVFELAERFGIDLLAGQGLAPEADRLAISESDAALLADYFNRCQGQNDPCGGELNRYARDPQPEEYEAPSRARRGEEASQCAQAGLIVRRVLLFPAMRRIGRPRWRFLRLKF